MLENKLVELLDKIADGVGVAAPRVYEIAMMQVVIDAVMGVLFFVVAAIVLIKVKSIIAGKIEKNEIEDEIGIVLLWAVWWVCFIVIFLAGCGVTMDLVTAILNPEYEAIKKFLPK